MNKVTEILSNYIAQIIISLIVALVVGGGLFYVKISQTVRHPSTVEYPDHDVPDSESYDMLKSNNN